MITTKHLLFTFLIVCFFASAKSQEAQGQPVKELAIATSNFNSFGVHYKSTLSDNWLVSLSLADISFNYDENSSGLSSSFNMDQLRVVGNFQVGIENQKHLTDKFLTYMGLNLIVGGYFQQDEKDDATLPIEARTLNTYYYQAGIGLSLGGQYELAPGLYIGGRLFPSIVYQHRNQEKYSSYDGVNYDIYNTKNKKVIFDANSNFLTMYLAYRWDK